MLMRLRGIKINDNQTIDVVELSMASIEQQELSNFIKTIHSDLRELSLRIGPDAAWQQHLQNHQALHAYSKKMQQLSETYWNDNQTGKNNRIEWIHDFCASYFDDLDGMFSRIRDKEVRIANALIDSLTASTNEFGKTPIRLLDVGSCFNPLKRYDRFEATGIDIAPADGSGVYACDFLTVPVLDDTVVLFQDNRVVAIPMRHYDVVVFSLLLEYMPASGQRMVACQKAFDVLKPEGVLIIITPDSKHIGANAKLMKNWRYTLSLMGFSRIRIEKLTHLTCMAFRKSLYPEVPQRWARIHCEAYMTNEINIPQDFVDTTRGDSLGSSKISPDSIKNAFYELPKDL